MAGWEKNKTNKNKMGLKQKQKCEPQKNKNRIVSLEKIEKWVSNRNRILSLKYNIFTVDNVATY